MNWLVDHPKQLIHLVCFVNMPHFSSLKSESSGSSYILVKCAVCACEGLERSSLSFLPPSYSGCNLEKVFLLVLTESIWYVQ